MGEHSILIAIKKTTLTFNSFEDDTVMEGKAGRVKKKFKKSHAGDEEDEEILVNNNTTGFVSFNVDVEFCWRKKKFATILKLQANTPCFSSIYTF